MDLILRILLVMIDHHRVESSRVDSDVLVLYFFSRMIRVSDE
jgi:hypothetical protein